MSPRIEPASLDDVPPDVAVLLEAAERDAGGAANVNRTMARNPGLFRKFVPFVGKLILAGKLPARERELVIMRTAWLCDSEYEWGQHHRIALAAGLSEAELERVAACSDAAWSDEDQTLLDATDELVEGRRITRPTWDNLAARFDDAQLVELTICIGAYVMVGGFLNSVEVEPEAGVVGFPVERAGE